MNWTNFDSFEAAGKAVLAYLHQQLGFKLWMITRTDGNDWIVLQSEDHGYSVKSGDLFRWQDSFCSQMVQGKGPCIAPQSDEVPAYVTAPIASQVPIKSYVGFPLLTAEGELFGTLCAIDPEPKTEQLFAHEPLITLLSQLLSRILQQEMAQRQLHRQYDQLAQEANTDALTGVFNRRGWENLLAQQSSRCIEMGSSAAVFVIDLDDLKVINDQNGHAAGDQLLISAATLLKASLWPGDILARIGGDEFVMISFDQFTYSSEAFYDRLCASFAEAKISASVGMALCNEHHDLDQTLKQADERMYAQKRARKAKMSLNESN